MKENMDIKVADLYVRIPIREDTKTEGLYHEQLNQLKMHCVQRGLKVDRIIVDRGSGKTFDRVHWKEYQSWIESTRSDVSIPRFLLYTTPEKLSRSPAETYEMMKHLKSFAVYPLPVQRKKSDQLSSIIDFANRKNQHCT